MNKEQVKQQYEEFTNTFAASLTLTRPIVRSTGAMVMMGLLPETKIINIDVELNVYKKLPGNEGRVQQRGKFKIVRDRPDVVIAAHLVLPVSFSNNDCIDGVWCRNRKYLLADLEIYGGFDAPRLTRLLNGS